MRKKLYAKPQILNDLMLISGYSVGGMASELGVHVSHFSSVKNGRTSPSPDLAKKISFLLGVSLSEIFELRSSDIHVKN